MLGSSPPLSPLIKAMQTAVSGIEVQTRRVLVITQNMASAGMRGTPENPPYQRQVIAFQNVYDKKTGTNLVRVKGIYKDKSNFNPIYMPEDPLADKNGYILETNIKPTLEMNDLREASRSHESNLKAFEKALSMLQSISSLLKN